ncbi:MAG: acyl-CoA thioesterase [Clostridiales bacterium]|nr:acyl-CoA thioesterase [Clostridiales bacterium]
MQKDKRTRLTMSQVMLPYQADSSGKVHLGEILKMMDSTAGATAQRYARSNVVTARVDELKFHSPIFVGALVTCTGTIAFVGKSSMEVIVTVDVEDLEADEPPHRAKTAYFTMVALDRMGRPREVPKLVIETEEEIKNYEEGKKRYESYKLKRKGK